MRCCKSTKIDLSQDLRPLQQKIRPLAPPLQEKLKLQLEYWLKDEVIEPFTLSSPLVPVTKKNETKPWCLDVRMVTKMTVRDILDSRLIRLI